MRIKTVTITGPDNRTNVDDLSRLQEKYPFVEWGILFSGQTSVGAPRYPTFDWIHTLEGKGLNLSGHLCGDYARQVVVRGDTSFMEHYTMFNRFQLNANFSQTKVNLYELADTVNRFDDRRVTFQMNAANRIVVEWLKLLTIKQFDILHDASGGRGTEIKTIPEPSGFFTGYAGGINTENVQNICEKITAHVNQSQVWIDMETGVRTNDVLDLDKVTEVLEKVSFFIK